MWNLRPRHLVYSVLGGSNEASADPLTKVWDEYALLSRRDQSDAVLATSSTPQPTTRQSAATLVVTPTLAAPSPGAGLRWEWAILTTAVLAVTVGYLVGRLRRTGE